MSNQGITAIGIRAVTAIGNASVIQYIAIIIITYAQFASWNDITISPVSQAENQLHTYIYGNIDNSMSGSAWLNEAWGIWHVRGHHYIALWNIWVRIRPRRLFETLTVCCRCRKLVPASTGGNSRIMEWLLWERRSATFLHYPVKFKMYTANEQKRCQSILNYASVHVHSPKFTNANALRIIEDSTGVYITVIAVT